MGSCLSILYLYPSYTRHSKCYVCNEKIGKYNDRKLGKNRIYFSGVQFCCERCKEIYVDI